MPRSLIRFLPAPVCVLLLLQPVVAGPLNDALPHVNGTRAIVLEQLEALTGGSSDHDLRPLRRKSSALVAREVQDDRVMICPCFEP